MSKSTQVWYPPSAPSQEPLRIYNSLTRSKVEFVPRQHGVVTWYNCGPTVYDAAHMGHARNYVTVDILRRIMRDYFSYNVHFVQNVTDIDDKIILRARSQFFIDELKQAQGETITAELVEMVKKAWSNYWKKVTKYFPEMDGTAEQLLLEEKTKWWEVNVVKSRADQEWMAARIGTDEKLGMNLSALITSRSAIHLASASSADISPSSFITQTTDVLSPYLLSLYASRSLPHSVFRSLSTHFEDSFNADMKALNVLPPTTTTRATEFIPPIVSFIERLIEKGYAYATPSKSSDGAEDVWFDSRAFDGKEERDGEGWKHTYAKNAPWNKGNKELLDEGEGSLTEGGKRSPSDFALWKSSKPGEPSWKSPWGEGRPGWHIECSAMGSHVFGSGMDFHSGGIDLTFPHHDNELAQAEAYHGCKQWVNYFIHMGHLHIEGLKMSKSLKNFITIQEFLKNYSARQLRLAFLAQVWSNRMDFKEASVQQAKTDETTITNFFTNVNALLSEPSASIEGEHRFHSAESTLLQDLREAQSKFDNALRDSFNTPLALQTLLSLINTTNTYIARGRSNIDPEVLREVARWISLMVRMFGLSDTIGEEEEVGWGTSEGRGGKDVLPYLRVLSSFRDEVRRLALEKKEPKEFLLVSDKLRDEELVELGVALDDQDDGRALVKLVDPSILREARDAKRAAAAEKAAKKAASAKAAEEKRREKLERGRLAPTEMFKKASDLELFSQWDEDGIPTLDKEGKEIAKSRRKKLVGEWEKQKKAHAEFLDGVKEGFIQ
ncbi:cysteinyl-tRNA synthetase [Atractiella rhizophila]|nr:cysteinyl-tRNA synthetase [Atractiella rhizophila]